MSLKRALVVDDSKSARLVLRRLLEKYNLTVDTAESAEEALEFLVEQQVDVIFMDHTMPGMDGLQAVSELKNNPRTAMIPVMMYTAKEGEVYVGQARALGAVGVLPKQVHPAELFKILEGLGLVTDRRAKTPPRLDATQEAGVEEGSLDDQVQGVALQALVERLLLEQRSELRSDILSSHQVFAERVADEIFRKQSATLADPEQLLESVRQSQQRWRTATLLTVIPLLLAAIAYFATASRVSDLDDENAQLRAQVSNWEDSASEQTITLAEELSREQERSDEAQQTLIGALQDSINQSNAVPFSELPLSDYRQELLDDLLSRLVDAGFVGVVRLESHLGEFCLSGSDFSNFELAEDSLSIGDCDYVGHPLDDSVSIADRQSINFANFLTSSPLVNESGILVEVVALPRSESIRRYAYPATLTRAGEWNEIAGLNHRVEVTLVPAVL
ncbi:MAG: response regulator [Pseudomonadota bacterium]